MTGGVPGAGTLTSTLATLGTCTSLTLGTSTSSATVDTSTLDFTGTILGTSANFTSVAASCKSTFVLIDSTFFASVLPFFTSTPPLQASFTDSGTMGMIGAFATSFTGAGRT